MKFIFILIFLAMVIGCASSKKDQLVSDSLTSGENLDESFDPLLLHDDDIAFVMPEAPAEDIEPVLFPLEEKNNTPTIQENKLIDGFRVQIISIKDLESAARAKSIAVEQFDDLQLKFYLEFDSPYYKVRIGDFKSRDDAERTLTLIRSRGYPKAWIVKTKVWSNPEFPAVSDSAAVDLPKID
jgi:hypothetical protein